MALSNSEKQQRWRERHLTRRRQVQRIAGLLLRRTWSDEHFKEIGDLLQSMMSRDAVAALRRALKPMTNAALPAEPLQEREAGGAAPDPQAMQPGRESRQPY
jgi:hypothetical protein